MMKIFSWNINGLRAVIRKNALKSFLETEKPDLLCLQEAKINRAGVESEKIEEKFPDYAQYYSFAARPGYSGTAIWINKSLQGNEIKLVDPLDEGRLTAVEFEKFYLISVYVPNAKPDLSRLTLREKDWGPFLKKTISILEKTKPVIIAGDFNVAHEPIDLARPKENVGKHGYTVEEREDFTKLLAGTTLIDAFRTLHPEKIAYSWWSHWGNARANNVGWRIDYLLASKSLKPNIKEAEIHPEILGSDHCPVSIEINL